MTSKNERIEYWRTRARFLENYLRKEGLDVERLIAIFHREWSKATGDDAPEPTQPLPTDVSGYAVDWKDHEPRYKHDCNQCVFLGHEREYDLYYCPQEGLPTILARYGNWGGDYLSGMPTTIFRTREPLSVGRERARAFGLRLAPDTTVSGYGLIGGVGHGPGGATPPDEDPHCHTCNREFCICGLNAWMHLDDPEWRARENELLAEAVAEGLVGYDPSDAVVGFESLVAG